ncbi:hypothetical protein J8L84_20140, partial [Alteromonas sp. MMG017]|uniref:hypothetical protein n=1 Tax=Alteromonas sp. MMG017 TaxID=2822692 RepID=UPI001B3A0604
RSKESFLESKVVFKLLLILSFILVAILSFSLGVSFGVASDQESFKNLLVPVLGVIGNWVAGIGALGAVITSLWLAEKQRKLDSEQIKTDFGLYVAPPNMSSRLATNVTSTGNKPAYLNSISILSEQSSVAISIAELGREGNQLPMSLSYGQKGFFFFPIGIESHINDFVKQHCNSVYKGLRLSINTNLNQFEMAFPAKVIKHLQEFER